MSPVLLCSAPLCYFFLKCCIFGESHFHQKYVMTWFLIFGSSLHCAGKCMVKLYAAYITGAWQSLWKNRSLNCQFSHSNSFILSLYMYVLCWLHFVCFSPIRTKNNQTRFLFDKNNQFLASKYEHFDSCY